MRRGMLLCPRLERRSKRVGTTPAPDPGLGVGSGSRGMKKSAGRSWRSCVVTRALRCWPHSAGEGPGWQCWPWSEPGWLAFSVPGSPSWGEGSRSSAGELHQWHPGSRRQPGSCWGQARAREPTALQGAMVHVSVVCRKKNAASFAYVDSVQVSSDSLDCLTGFQWTAAPTSASWAQGRSAREGKAVFPEKAVRLRVHYKHTACFLWAHCHCPPDFSALSDGGAFATSDLRISRAPGPPTIHTSSP